MEKGARCEESWGPQFHQCLAPAPRPSTQRAGGVASGHDDPAGKKAPADRGLASELFGPPWMPPGGHGYVPPQGEEEAEAEEGDERKRVPAAHP